jgi:glutathione peroxidase
MKIFLLPLLAICLFSFSSDRDSSKLYNIKINALEGDNFDLAQFKGKKILFVNVASKCGYTPQYAGLQELHNKYKSKLTVIGVPCNQFMNQEPGGAEEIKSFCEKNYGVKFPITEKIQVKGGEQHPLYSWLTKKSENGKMDSKVKWNFCKYLVDENGELVAFFESKVKPLSEEITKHLN